MVQKRESDANSTRVQLSELTIWWGRRSKLRAISITARNLNYNCDGEKYGTRNVRAENADTYLLGVR